MKSCGEVKLVLILWFNKEIVQGNPYFLKRDRAHFRKTVIPIIVGIPIAISPTMMAICLFVVARNVLTPLTTIPPHPSPIC